MSKSSSTIPIPDPITIGEVPAWSTGLVMMATANAYSLSAQNAVQAQQAGNIIMTCATAAGVASILGLSSTQEKELFDKVLKDVEKDL